MSFFKKLGKAIEKPFRTGRSAAERQAGIAGQKNAALSNELMEILREAFSDNEPLADASREGVLKGIGGLSDLLGGIDAPREEPEEMEISERDPGLIGESIQAARMPFAGRRRALRRRGGSRSGSGSGGLGSFLSGNEMQANMAGSRAAFQTQRSMQDSILNQQRSNEQLRYNYDLSEQDRPFTQKRATLKDLLNMPTTNKTIPAFLQAITGVSAANLGIADTYAKQVGAGPGSKILASWAGSGFG